MNKVRASLTNSRMAWVLSGLIGAVSVAMPQAVLAEQNDDVTVNVAGFRNGVVTDAMEQGVAIDGKAYGVMPDVVVTNQFGKPDELNAAEKGLRVYFHLREDKENKHEKIDRMVVIIPQ